jgi:hypothetical protein
MWQMPDMTLLEGQQLHGPDVTPSGVAVVPAPPHSTLFAVPKGRCALAVKLTVVVAVSVMPV